MYQCGLLQQLCTILMATGVPADILTEVKLTVFLTKGKNINKSKALNKKFKPIKHVYM